MAKQWPRGLTTPSMAMLRESLTVTILLTALEVARPRPEGRAGAPFQAVSRSKADLRDAIVVAPTSMMM